MTQQDLDIEFDLLQKYINWSIEMKYLDIICEVPKSFGPVTKIITFESWKDNR